jgi:GDPmannose 4,6-dehydratase
VYLLGDLNPSIDWGYAGDYVEAMWKMVQQDGPDDYVIATGETRSVREFVETALVRAGLEPDIDKYVSYDKEMSRPSEVELLVGEASKAHANLGWSSTKAFNELVGLMIENDLELESH